MSATYDKLVEQFALVKRPYITVVNALRKLEYKFCKDRELSSTSPFNYNIFCVKYKSGIGRKIFYKIIPGYSDNIFQQILSRKNAIGSAFKKTPLFKQDKADIDRVKRDVILNFENKSDFDYILAVYHYIYMARMNTNYLVFNAAYRNLSEFTEYNIAQCIQLMLQKSKAEYPNVTDENNNIYKQIPRNSNSEKISLLKFLDSIFSINADTYLSQPFVLYVPIFDGELNDGVFRGFFNVSLTSHYDRQEIIAWVKDHYEMIQYELNTAFIAGAHDQILSRYTTLGDPVEHLKDNLYRLHNWGSVEFSDTETPQDRIWWTYKNKVIIDINNAILRSDVKERPKAIHKYLVLLFPANRIICRYQVNGRDSYLEKRIDQIISLLDDLLLKWQMLKHATKSAVSTVMSRNASHNIGSHVLSSLGTTSAISPVFYGNPGNWQCATPPHSEPSIDVEKYRAAKFNSYLKSRMDYLADVATGAPSFEVTQYFYRELIQGLLSNRILLHRISGLTGFFYDIQVIIEGNPVNGSDIKVSLPAGQLGCQAFYVIVENVIRNTAKHSKAPPKTLIFNIDIKNFENDNSLYEVTIYDNVPVGNIRSVMKELNGFITGSVLDPGNYGLRRGGWGMLEMAISAAFLRGLSAPDYELHYNKSDIFQCVIVNEDNLGFRFYLAKGKNYLVVYKHELSKPILTQLINRGIWVLKPEEFKLASNNFPHDYFIYAADDSDTVMIMANNITSLTPRRIGVSSATLHNLFTNTNDAEAIEINLLDLSTKEWIDRVLISDTKYIIAPDVNPHDNGGMATLASLQLVYPDTECSSSFNAVLLNHSTNYQVAYESDRIHFVDPLSSLQKLVQPNYCRGRLSFFGIPPHTVALMCESIALRIGVIDERIQKALAHEVYSGVTLSMVYEKTNIFSPSISDANLGLASYFNSHRPVKNDLINWLDNNVKQLHALVIHLGILEKLVDNTDRTIDVVINKYIRCIKEDLILIITSGRGQPHNLPKNERFVNLSSIIDAFVEDRSKYKICKLIMSSRRVVG